MSRQDAWTCEDREIIASLHNARALNQSWDAADARVMLARTAQTKLSASSPYQHSPAMFVRWEESSGPWHEYFFSRPELLEAALS